MTSSNQISVMSPLLVGMITIFCTILVHALILGFIIMEVRRDLKRGRVGVRFWTDVAFVTGATLIAIAGHLAEMGLWAIAMKLCGAFSDWSVAFYYSAVNYTTLGDSGVAIAARWKLLGALAAADGMLMFGVSTAMIFAVIQRLVQSRLGDVSSTIKDAGKVERRS
jgi:hypothetical protein